jgi:hypothetical protein
LLVSQQDLPAGKTLHIGTLDVDIGLALAVLDEKRYHEICERLRAAAFRPDTNEAGRTTNQRWRIDSEGRTVTIDFLVPATSEQDRGGALRNFEEGFAAIITPGLELAFQDRRLVRIEGETLRREKATRDVWVCEAGAFTIPKALAFDGRGENKDAYDLVYILQNYGGGIDDICERLAPVLASTAGQKALKVLQRDFAALDSLGPRRVAAFLGDEGDDVIRADAAGAVRSLLARCQK